MCRRTFINDDGKKGLKGFTSDVPHTYTVVYDSASHLGVLTQRLGSIWHKVVGFCILNVVLTIGLRLLHDKGDNAFLDVIRMSSTGHKFMKFVLAFLVVNRVKMSLDRYMEARKNIGILYRETRELIQNLVVFTDDQQQEAAKQWRHDMAYQILLLLRSAMAVLNHSVHEESVWDLPELNGKEKEIVKQNLLFYPGNEHYGIGEETTEFEENMRVPVFMAYILTDTLLSQSRRLKQPLPPPRENKLLNSIDSFMAGYHGLRKFLTTPTPFPLIQMSRTFIFLYVFTIPSVMLNDDSGLAAHCFFVALITLGFIGLESVAIELDDPFGDDPNDFNNLALATAANEDTYLTILDVDGREWTDKLRERMMYYHSTPPPRRRSSKEPLGEKTPLVHRNSLV